MDNFIISHRASHFFIFTTTGNKNGVETETAQYVNRGTFSSEKNCCYSFRNVEIRLFKIITRAREIWRVINHV